MKTWTSTTRLLTCTGAIFCLTLPAARAADSAGSPQVVVSQAPAAAPAALPAPLASDAAPAKLPYGVEDVIKLSRAQISDDIIQNYVQNSGTVYNLSPNDLVYLRNQGVSDRVVATMLEQRSRLATATAQSAPAPGAASAPASAEASSAAAPTYNYAQSGSTDAQPQPAYVQPAAPSSVYVIPYPQATTPFYSGYYSPYYRPYYGGYYGGYWGPSISLGFGFGGGWSHGGSYHGGWHGGGHGGFHGHR